MKETYLLLIWVLSTTNPMETMQKTITRQNKTTYLQSLRNKYQDALGRRNTRRAKTILRLIAAVKSSKYVKLSKL